ncbi:CDP-glycerol glycerophosphotransferase family protein [Parvibacter caecicola]|uniref:CDP-glycerol glycerophosphotransferase family protein n=1 Tax=Parvibacter caecicola TaxID=747645 RepID=UPI002730AE98|nr:CDP-glycerol glycerophosphotransferase family protein [Parvibacter caecicola]
MGKVKLLGLKAGLAAMGGVYALMKLAPVKKRYTFITKLQDTPTVDFEILQEALRQKKPEHEIVNLCKPMDNLVAYVPHMFVQMWHLATSEAVFLDRSCLMVNGLTHRPTLKVVQLWHALGNMKKFGYAILDTPEGESSELAEVCHMHRGYTDILISSRSFEQDYLEGFRCDPSVLREIPQPRADVLCSSVERERRKTEARKKLGLSDSGKKVVVYAPTFRKDPMPESKKRVQDLVDAINHDEWAFVYSKHPVGGIECADPRIMESPIPTLDALFAADALITDYSTVMYEAGLLGLPVFLYAYDWEDYKEKREDNIDLEHDVPTVFSGDPKVIARAVETGEGFSREAFQDFVSRNVRMPGRGTCCEAIIKLL